MPLLQVQGLRKPGLGSGPDPEEYFSEAANGGPCRWETLLQVRALPEAWAPEPGGVVLFVPLDDRGPPGSWEQMAAIRRGLEALFPQPRGSCAPKLRAIAKRARCFCGGSGCASRAVAEKNAKNPLPIICQDQVRTEGAIALQWQSVAQCGLLLAHLQQV